MLLAAGMLIQFPPVRTISTHNRPQFETFMSFYFHERLFFLTMMRNFGDTVEEIMLTSTNIS